MFGMQYTNKIIMKSFSEHIKGSKPVLVDFFATWCGPCQSMPPILKEVKARLGDKITVLKIDVDRNPEIARQYEIRGVPTLMIFQNQKIVWKQSGVASATALIQQIAPLCSEIL